MGFHWNAALDLLYPPRCCGCGRNATHPGFCAACHAAMVVPCTPICSICGLPFGTLGGADHPCSTCLKHRPRFRQARACTTYDASVANNHPLKSALQRYKYNGDVSLAPALAELLIARTPLTLETYDVIVPVPLHVRRLRWRGFNQAQLLAQRLRRHATQRIDPFSLRRTRATPPQVELNRAARQRNVAGAFQVIRPDRVHGLQVLLVDDVYTTGATVDECSGALLQAGATLVDVLVLARAILH